MVFLFVKHFIAHFFKSHFLHFKRRYYQNIITTQPENNFVIWIINPWPCFPFFRTAIDWTISILKHVDTFLFSAPSSPRNVQLLSVTDTSIKISWWEPARANGVLLGYRVYFLHRNFTSVQTIRDNKSAMVETLTRLSKYNQLHVNLKSVFKNNLVYYEFFGQFTI